MTPQVGRAGLWAPWPGGADHVAVLSLGLPVDPAQPLNVTSFVSATPAVRPGAVWYCQ
jgi:hypothetical protein